MERLSNFNLSEDDLARLYEEFYDLKVPVGDKDQPIELPGPESYLVSGSSDAMFKVIVNGSDFQTGTGEYEFLGKILTAIKLDYQSIALFACSLPQTNTLELFAPLKKTQLFFGFPDDRLHPYFDLIQTGDLTRCMAPNLTEIMQDVSLKKALWDVLQRAITNI